jgi:hypothetical protein
MTPAINHPGAAGLLIKIPLPLNRNQNTHKKGIKKVLFVLFVILIQENFKPY